MTGAANTQSRVIAFLSKAGTIDAGVPRVFRTHAAMVFVGAERAFKIKRAVHYPFLDFSTLERRRDACLREIAVNRSTAADIYLGAVPIVERDGHELAIGGPGTPVEWAVEMRAFAQSDLLAARATAGRLDSALLDELADVVAAMHDRASPRDHTDAPAKMLSIIEDVSGAALQCSASDLAAVVGKFRTAGRDALTRCRPTLAARATGGNVRLCHGDLHLSNIVMWRGRPTPFDAIEFSDEIATVDTLYDLAFLLMDLDRRAGRAAANRVMNRYLWRRGSIDDARGLAAMPLFLGLRAAIRALVATERAGLAGKGTPEAGAALTEAGELFAAAVAYLRPPAPRLVAVGGLSGTGKSTVATALSTAILPAPGAVHLRSDLERKWLAGVAPTERLGRNSYTPEASATVYARLVERAGAILEAGHSVIVDAVFLKNDERVALEDAGRKIGVTLEGLWLTAPDELLAQRVAERKGDASDATPEVVAMQSAQDAGDIPWRRIDASGSAEATLAAAGAALSLTLPSD